MAEISINGSAATDVDFDNNTPAPPLGGARVTWQTSGSSPTNVSAHLDLAWWLDAFRMRPFYFSDFFNVDVDLNHPFLTTVMATGTVVAPNAGLVTANHPGVVKVTCSATVNSGARIVTDVAGGILLGGGEVFEAIVNFTNVSASQTYRIGFHDATTSTDAVDGAYFELVAGTLKGKTISNGVPTQTGTTFTPTAGTWYRLRVTVNSNATQVNFDVWNDAGTSQFAANTTTNIPTASGRETAAGLIATSAGAVVADLLHLDFMGVYLNDRVLTR